MESLIYLNQDLLLEIALHIDINEIYNLSLTNNAYKKILSDPFFWVKKYNQDKLPIFNTYTSIADWVNDYIATKKVIDLIWFNKKEEEILGIKLGLKLTVNHPIHNEIIPFKIDSKIEVYNLFINDDSVQYDIYFEDDDDIIDLKMDHLKIIQLMKSIILLEKNVFISDQHSVSYHWKDLEQNMLNHDRYYKENYNHAMTLRKKLLNQYHLNF